MSVREVKASGNEALTLATQLLQRARLADRVAGLWEAGDVQWSWRAHRESDDAEKLFWLDEDGPVAGVLLTSWKQAWQCDPIVVPGVSTPDPEVVWNRALELVAEHSPHRFDVPVDDDDPIFTELAGRSGLVAAEQDGTGWMDADDRSAVPAMPDGFVLVDRTQRDGTPHPMRDRNGAKVAERLAECSLYDPSLDLAVETTDGRSAGYSLYWFDPVTRVGLVEPVRIEDEFHRRGLARAMVAAGVDRLASKGAQRMKVSYETEAAKALYRGVGFQPTSTTTWYSMSSE